MTTKIDFVKGHCGWDVVTLIPEGQVPAAQELAAAVKIVCAPVDGGLEVGFLGLGDRPGEIRLRMVSSTAKNWIQMCGGMTQVIGKALVETSLRDRFSVDTSKPRQIVNLITPSGRIPIEINIDDRKVTRVSTTMDTYLDCLYQQGIESLVVEGIPLLRVGDYAVIAVTALERRYPNVDFTRRDEGRHLDIVNEVLRVFGRHLGDKGIKGMLYDERPEGPGTYRVFPRFFSEDLAAARIPWEFQCGTGSIAVAIALANDGRLAAHDSHERDIVLEWGSYRATRDPYGIRTSLLRLELAEDRVTAANYAHSVIEILAEGTLSLPDY